MYIEFIYNEKVYLIHVIKKKVKNINFRIKPDLSMTISIPSKMLKNDAFDFIKRNSKKIRKIIEKFEKSAYDRAMCKNDNALMFLGRKYKKNLISDNVTRITINEEHIEIRSTDVTNLQKIDNIVDRWYKNKSVEIVSTIFDDTLYRMRYIINETPEIVFRKMKRRWGTCYYQNKRIILNSKLIMASKKCIEYVIVHELIHLVYPSHSKEFYGLLTSIIPDWKKTRKELNEKIGPYL